MRIQFDYKQQAARFATAVANVTGREPLMSRTETFTWLVQSPDLNNELACAIYTLLEQGIPCHHVTLDQVADQVEEGRQAAAWTPAERTIRRPAAILPLLPAAFTAFRGRRREAVAAAR
jgi:hypothetical protein